MRNQETFFSSYTKACALADELLFSVGNISIVNQACSVAPLGKLTPEALYIHISALDQLPPILRVFEGCARGYIGRVDNANIVKINRREPKVAYLSYPNFEEDPHPSLSSSLSVNLQTFRIKARDFTGYKNPPILHRKETFLSSDHPLRPKFERLTRSEEAKGLYKEPTCIGTREGWNAILVKKGLALRAHRLVSVR